MGSNLGLFSACVCATCECRCVVMAWGTGHMDWVCEPKMGVEWAVRLWSGGLGCGVLEWGWSGLCGLGVWGRGKWVWGGWKRH
eukprot:3499499-Alexandrium_andersonii.AAC.1